MSNLRIKYKRLKREAERLRYNTVEPRHIVYNQCDVVKLRSSLMLTEVDMDHLPQCAEQVKRMLLEEVKNYIKVDFVGVDLDNPGLPFSMLKADLSVVRKD